MFSEYASRYLTKSQRPMPLFNHESGGNSDYLDDVSGSDSSINSESDSGDSIESDSSERPSDPPRDLLVDPQHRNTSNKRTRKTGLSLWRDSEGRPNTNAESSNTSNNVGAKSNSISRRTEYTVSLIYIGMLASMLATGWLSTVAPGRSAQPIMRIVSRSLKPLIAYTSAALIASALWLHCMRRHAKPIVATLVVAVPVLLCSASAYSLIMSVHWSTGALPAHGAAHAAMRLSAIGPFVLALVWCACLQRAKSALSRSTDYIVYSAGVYGRLSPPVVILTLCSQASSVIATLLWALFLLSALTQGILGLLLSAWFGVMYFWTCNLAYNLLRSVLVCMTSEWYALPAVEEPTDEPKWNAYRSLTASIHEVMTYHFPSACTSALLNVQIRIPFAPKYAVSLARRLVIGRNGSDGGLLDPLTMLVAVLERCSLQEGVKLINSSKFEGIDRTPHRLAKMLLKGARVSCAVCVGFVAWVHADRVQDASSAYGYSVALVAFFSAWAAAGAPESVLSMLCDALLCCFALNEQSPRRNEIEHLFGNAQLE